MIIKQRLSEASLLSLCSVCFAVLKWSKDLNFAISILILFGVVLSTAKVNLFIVKLLLFSNLTWFCNTNLEPYSMIIGGI